MRICVLGMVKNEADIIEPFIRHTLRFADHITLLDNASHDGTRQILVRLMRDGLPLTVLDDPVTAYVQAEKMTWLYRRMVPLLRPDHMLFLDADEFLLPGDRGALEAALAAMPPGRFGAIPWRTYIARPEDLAEPPPNGLRHRLRTELEGRFIKVALRCDQSDPEATWIGQGNHKLDTAAGLRHHHLPGLALAHVPVRSLEQFRKKVLFGYLAYGARQRMGQRGAHGGHWVTLGRRLLQGGEIEPMEITRFALNYARMKPEPELAEALVEDPLPAMPASRYGALARHSALATVTLALEAAQAGEDRFTAALHARGKAAARAGMAEKKNSTAFDAEWHAEKLYVDLPPFRHMLDRFAPRSVLDLGCGIAAYLLEYRLAGVETLLGLDAFDPGAALLLPGAFRQEDLAEPIELGQVFDLVISVEVIEHLPEAAEDAFLDNIVRHAGQTILFSGAAPGQPGVRHINCRPAHHWIAHFARRGWHPSLEDTRTVRALASFPWFRHNLLVFRRGPAPAQATLDELRRLEAPPARWNHRPAIVTSPLDGFVPARMRVPAGLATAPG